MHPSESPWFDHEKLGVYRDALVFIGWLSDLLESANRLGDVKDQLERSSTSIALNIAEGNGKYTPKDVAGSSIPLTARRSNARPGWTFWLSGGG
jgi:hypothetical protein